MEVEIFVHGVPNGHDVWGKTEVEKYFDSFYGPSCNDEVKYHIQVAQTNGRLYCYYNYLLYNNVQDCKGRSGSFLGLTMRMDLYCKDFSVIYSVLDTVFNVYLNHSIIEKNANHWRYTISSFKERNDILNNVYDTISNFLKYVLKEENVCSLNGFINNAIQKSLNYNLYEVTNQTVEQLLRQNGQIALSPYYPTTKERTVEQQLAKRVAEAEQSCEKRIEAFKASKNSEIQSLKANIVESQQQCNARISDIKAKKEEEIKRLRDKISMADEECKIRVQQAIENEAQKYRKKFDELKHKLEQEKSILNKKIQQLKANNKEANHNELVPLSGRSPLLKGGSKPTFSKTLLFLLANTILLMLSIIFNNYYLNGIDKKLEKYVTEETQGNSDNGTNCQDFVGKTGTTNNQNDCSIPSSESDSASGGNSQNTNGGKGTQPKVGKDTGKGGENNDSKDNNKPNSSSQTSPGGSGTPPKNNSGNK